MEISRNGRTQVQITGIDTTMGNDVSDEELEDFLSDEYLSEVLSYYGIDVINDMTFEFLEADRDYIVFQCTEENADKLTRKGSQRD